jgi:galactokinase
MVERPYKCTLCHASFRNESGMMWHVSRRHEAPQALEALGKNYNEKLDKLRKDNFTQAQEINDLKTKLDDTTMKLMNANMNVAKEIQHNIDLMLQIRNMTDDQRRLAIAFVARDQILQQRLGIKLPNPFGESDNNPQTPKST